MITATPPNFDTQLPEFGSEFPEFGEKVNADGCLIPTHERQAYCTSSPL